MRFHVRLIKEVYQQEYSLDMIVDFVDTTALQSFLHETKLLSISTDQYRQSPETFGDTYGMFSRNKTNYNFVVHGTDIQNTVRSMTFMWIEVSAINSYKKPLDMHDAIAAIKKITSDVAAIIQQKESQVQQKLDMAKETYSDANMQKIQSYVTRVLQDADFAIQKYADDKKNIDILQSNISNLKKMKLSKNTEKLEEIIRTIYLTIESMEATFLSLLPNDTISPDSTVRIPLFIGLYDKRERAKKLHDIGVHLSINERLYAYAGRSIVMTTLLSKEIHALLKRQWSKWSTVLQNISLGVYITIITLSLIWLYMYITQLGWFDVSVGEPLLVWGILWISLQCGLVLYKKYRWHTTTILLISFVIFICLWYIARWFLILH